MNWTDCEKAHVHLRIKTKKVVSGPLLFVVDRDLFQIFGFKHLSASKTADVIYAVASGQHFGLLMVASDFHNPGSFPF